MSSTVDATPAARSATLASRYRTVRTFSESLCETLNPEDCCVQSMPDASPIRWHLAHTTWFFETFVLSALPSYKPQHSQYAYLFNSYYNALGPQFPRARRGLLTRPTVAEVFEYRHEIDQQLVTLLAAAGATSQPRLLDLIELGLHHEQQHQELMLTDLKHLFSCNPLYPVYRAGSSPAAAKPVGGWSGFDEGIYWIGHEGNAFAYDNERPRHREFLESFEISNHLVTCGEFLQFIDDDGYRRPELWLSEGWRHVQDHGWQAPFYWVRMDDQWREFTLAGVQPLDQNRPVCHLSFFEADAFTRWAGCRLPTGAEWEVASQDASTDSNWADVLIAKDQAIHPLPNSDAQMFGHVWQWTASPYVAYPGYRPADGAIGEYNGKFMCNQYVLRGGSCATPSGHIRNTYRNFFPAEARWQFTGLRLAR